MLHLTCALCSKSTNYSAEELVGRYFICKHCQWLNLLHIERVQSLADEKANSHDEQTIGSPAGPCMEHIRTNSKSPGDQA